MGSLFLFNSFFCHFICINFKISTVLMYHYFVLNFSFLFVYLLIFFVYFYFFFLSSFFFRIRFIAVSFIINTKKTTAILLTYLLFLMNSIFISKVSHLFYDT